MTGIRCNMRASDAFSRSLGIAHEQKPAITLGHALDTVLILDGLERMIDDAFKRCRTADGRIDTRDVAHSIMVRMDQLRGPKTQRVDHVIDDSIAVNAFARLLTEAIETRQNADGALNLRAAAAHIFAAMRENQR